MAPRIVVLGSILASLACSQDRLQNQRAASQGTPGDSQLLGDPMRAGDSTHPLGDPVTSPGDSSISGPGDDSPPGDSDGGLPHTCQTGGVWGDLCDSAEAPLGGVGIWVETKDCTGQSVTTEVQTTAEGHFVLTGLPAGTQVVHLNTTPPSQFVVEVVPGEIVALSDPEFSQACASSPTRVAVVSGIFDTVETLLVELGIPYDFYSSYSGLGTSEAYALITGPNLQDYDAIFINCGREDRDFLPMVVGTSLQYDWGSPLFDSLRNFVASGGNLYASDWAWPVVEGVAGTQLDFLGAETVDGWEVMAGVSTSLVANIQDDELASYLGSEQFSIEFDLNRWAVLENHVGAQVLVQADIQAFAPDGTGLLSLSQVPLAIAVVPEAGGGTALFTSFHHHSQPTGAMTQVLRFLVFQL